MTTESFVQTAVNSIWKMKRHTVCAYCGRYRPTDAQRLCRPCAVKHVRNYYEYADSVDTDNTTHNQENNTHGE